MQSISNEFEIYTIHIIPHKISNWTDLVSLDRSCFIGQFGFARFELINRVDHARLSLIRFVGLHEP